MTGQKTHQNSTNSFRDSVFAGLATLVVVAVLVGGLAALSSGPVSPAQAQSGPTEISNWTDLNDTRTDLDGDYVLVNDLNASTPGYDGVVANRTATGFSEFRTGSFNESDAVTLTRTPLDSVTATNSSGVSVNVTITDAANGTVEFQENPGDGFSSIEFDYVTGEEQFVGFDPIGELVEKFTGTFDGQGNTIADLRINRPTENFIGLFVFIGTGGDLMKVSVTNTTVTGEDDVGGLVGRNNGTVTGSEASGSVTGESRVGGLVGSNLANVTESAASGSVTGKEDAGGLVGSSDGNVIESAASGSVNGSARVGGLVGFNFDGDITDAIANSIVSGETEQIGGLVGRSAGGSAIQNATARGTVNGGSFLVAGLVGSNVNSDVLDSASSADIEATQVAGSEFNESIAGLAGFHSGTIANSSASGGVTAATLSEVAGLVGDNRGEIRNAKASGSVNGSTQVGGLVGENRDGTVTGSAATGSVTGSGAVGGLVGQHRQGTLSESFAVGNVTSLQDVGGLVGTLGSTFLDPGDEAIVRDSYFDNQTTGQSTAVGTIEEGSGTAETRGEVTGLQTSQMQGESAETTMSTLDFQNTWETVTSPDYYPTLQAVEGPATLVVSNLTAPAEAPLGGEIDVTATVTNVGGAAGVQDVQFQFNGTTVANTTVALNASASTTVAFSPTLPDQTGTFTHGVFTNDDSQTAEISLVDPGPPSLPSSDDPPNDSDGDGLYEDIDGDSDFNIFDVQALFNGLDSDAVQDNPEAFNFNGDENPDEVSIFDVQGLFNDL